MRTYGLVFAKVVWEMLQQFNSVCDFTQASADMEHSLESMSCIVKCTVCLGGPLTCRYYAV